jgi:hypothetical protein
MAQGVGKLLLNDRKHAVAFATVHRSKLDRSFLIYDCFEKLRETETAARLRLRFSIFHRISFAIAKLAFVLRNPRERPTGRSAMDPLALLSAASDFVTSLTRRHF